jgi:hypothetical protein
VRDFLSGASNFPSSDPLTGTLQAFAVFAVGFAARPIGAALRALR